MHPLRRLLAAPLLAAGLAGPAAAHPHVWVDGGVDVAFDAAARIEALHVTWIYDEFETLYVLASHEIGLDAGSGLSEADRQSLVRRLSDWPEDFDGSAHLTVAGAPVPLAWPTGLDARIEDGRLHLTFIRTLQTPLDIAGRAAEIGFYERTYFFAFSITQEPELTGTVPACAARVVPFEADADTAEIRAVLAALGREEAPSGNPGAQLADRIVLTCD